MRPVPPRFIIALMLVYSACQIPQDPENTSEQVLKRGTLQVGIVENPPWASIMAEGPKGIEVTLVQRLARKLQVTPHWVRDNQSELMKALERHELDLVIGGIQEDDPSKAKIGMTRPYVTTSNQQGTEKHVLAIPPGENAWLMTIEQFLKAQKESITASLKAKRRSG